jgi:uncharacterized membrane protein
MDLTLRIGIFMLALEALVLSSAALFDRPLLLTLLSMLGANHIGGRLAFIAMGFEQGLSSFPIIAIIIYHNTMYLLIMYSLFVKLSSGLGKLRFIKGYMESLKNSTLLRTRRRKSWSGFVLFVFVWIPLPWTGAAIGSYIAHLVGYSTRQTLRVVAPAMWLGVVIWTLWFDELYAYLDRLGPGKTQYLTVALIGIPAVYSLIDLLLKRRRSSGNGGPGQEK